MAKGTENTVEDRAQAYANAHSRNQGDIVGIYGLALRALQAQEKKLLEYEKRTVTDKRRAA